MTKEKKINAAYAFGKAACTRGVQCAPALDLRNLEPPLKGNKVGEGIPVLKAWSRGWHSANLANSPIDR